MTTMDHVLCGSLTLVDVEPTGPWIRQVGIGNRRGAEPHFINCVVDARTVCVCVCVCVIEKDREAR